MLMMLVLVLLPVAFLRPPGAGAGEIIGGREAHAHSRPYMAYLEIKHGKSNDSCGGFLVSENFVLTAAHCNGDEINVTLGAHNISNKQEPSQQLIPARAKIPHPRYDTRTLNNDIMLLQLAKNVTLNKYVKTIPLPGAGEGVKPGTVCSTAGWGRVWPFLERKSQTLQEVEVKAMEDDECQLYSLYNASTMLCVGDPPQGKDFAEGDAGGPLVCNGTAQGIVSWGPPIPPGMYTKVSTFVNWIQEEMKKLQP